MTPEEYIGHKAFRTIKSERWPPSEPPCFAEWLHFRDGTVIFYLRGVATHSEPLRQMADVVAEDIYGLGNACHRCLFQTSFGKLLPTGEYRPHFSTTQRQGSENPWGTLCKDCRAELAEEATDKWRKRLLHLGLDPRSDAVESWLKSAEEQMKGNMQC